VLNNYSSFYKRFNQLITLYLKIVFETLVLRKVIFLKENDVLLNFPHDKFLEYDVRHSASGNKIFQTDMYSTDKLATWIMIAHRILDNNSVTSGTRLWNIWKYMKKYENNTRKISKRRIARRLFFAKVQSKLLSFKSRSNWANLRVIGTVYRSLNRN